MTEGLFILTTIFVAYVVYVIKGDSKDKKASGSTAAPAKKAAAKTKAKPAAKEKPAAKPKAKPADPKPKAATKVAAAPAEEKAPAEAPASNEVKNPKTGEVSTISSNYRFTKRWIKEALVEEGLLDKVYKGNEIDDAATKKINAALDKIKTLKKYQP